MEKISLSSEYEKIGNEIDKLIMRKEYEKLESFLTKIEASVFTFDLSKCTSIFYYIGTGKSVLAGHCNEFKKTDQVLSAMSYRKQSLFYMRKALTSYKKSNCTNKSLLLSIYTNYANELGACGRVIEALRIYRKAISIYHHFSMIIGNYGRTLNFYANMVNDVNHCKELHCYAYQSIKRSLIIHDPNMHEDAVNYFSELIAKYDSLPTKEYLSYPIVFDEYDLGETEEHDYRIWCLKNHLFLNPLNDLIEQETAFAHDPLTITQFTEYVDRKEVGSESNSVPPKWYSMLNQLKEEYIYSRFLCYEGSEKISELHYADKDVKLSYSDYNYINYSIRLEQLKSAFKTLFSIFDQIGFVINEFWKLGFSERTADAAHVFGCKNYPKDNVALSALYWSNCEFSERFGNADSASERDLKVLRNALEHKFVKVHEYDYSGNLQIEDDSFYHISEGELKKHTLRLLELAREWIMELVYAIDIEERKKDKGANAIELNIYDFDDKWKV